VIRLGDPQPGNFSPLYKGQVLVHGMGFSPDHKTLAVVSIGSNSVTFIDTATNASSTSPMCGRSPHEAFFTPDGKEVWVTVRGENYIAVLDARLCREAAHRGAGRAGMQIFSPDGKYGYICSSFNPETVVVSVADHAIVARVSRTARSARTSPRRRTASRSGSPEGHPARRWCSTPAAVQRSEDDRTGRSPTTSTSPARRRHVRLCHVGGLNEVKVFRTDDFSQVATSPGRQSAARHLAVRRRQRASMSASKTPTRCRRDRHRANKVVANIPIGQAPQAIRLCAQARALIRTTGRILQELGVAGQVAHLHPRRKGLKRTARSRRPASRCSTRA
jgi:hypothetical protein